MQKRHDEITQLFIDGEISIKTYFFLDEFFYKTAELYTINLN